ncbi:MAG: type III-B CRISPR module RAMP protein Cmr1 [Nitrososphaerota archaeon]|nr:type III-B CRISPR module RAMP protein Cmr1 [Nitrososphaerota archaeon]
MKTVSLECEVVTPMFTGGPDPKEGFPEIRAASLKGCLRFWYRAFGMGSSAEERRIFGSSDGGRSKVRIKVAEADMSLINQREDFSRTPGICYLGYGVIDKGKTVRKGFDAGSRFNLRLTFDDTLGAADSLSIMHALWAFFMLGGLGSRTRKGFGAIRVTNVVKDDISGLKWSFDSRAAFKQALMDFIRDSSAARELPGYTRWSRNARCILGPQQDECLPALNEFGKEFLAFRSAKNPACDTTALDDHDSMIEFIKTGQLRAIPLRAKFGLPHNYYFSRSIGAKAEVNTLEDEGKLGRRASPLMIHLQQFEDGKCSMVVTFLPAKFLPANRDVLVSSQTLPQFTQNEILNEVEFTRRLSSLSVFSDLNYGTLQNVLKTLTDKLGDQRLTNDLKAEIDNTAYKEIVAGCGTRDRKWLNRYLLNRFLGNCVMQKEEVHRRMPISPDDGYSAVEHFLSHLTSKGSEVIA